MAKVGSKMLLLAVLLPVLTWASPAPRPVAVAGPQPVVTASPVLTPPTRVRRGLVDDVKSLVGDLGSNIPTYVADGVANFFQGFPSGNAVQSSLGIDEAQLAAYPTQVLNLP